MSEKEVQMSNGSWTPGHWSPNSLGDIAGYNGVKIVPLFYLIDGNEEVSREEGHANADLISAAPELYEALERMTRRNKKERAAVGDSELWDEIIENAEQALAKARGED